MNTYLSEYLAYMRVEKNAAPSTISDYKLELEKFIFFMHKNGYTNTLDGVKTPLIRQYIQHIKETRCLTNTSVYKKIAILKSYFNYLADDEIIEGNPARKIRLPKKEKPLPRAVSSDEFNLLISSIKYDTSSRVRKNWLRDKLIFCMLYYCGLRRSELLALDWEDVNLGQKVIFVRKSKNKSGRIIPIHPKVYRLLDMYLEKRLPLDNYALFVGEMGKRLSKCSFYNLINRYLKKSGLKGKGYTAHSLRHSFATRLVENKTNLFMVQKLLGHACLDSTKIYVHFEDEGLRSAVESL